MALRSQERWPSWCR